MFKKLKLEVKDLSGKHALITGGNEGNIYLAAIYTKFKHFNRYRVFYCFALGKNGSKSYYSF
jgi:hypothetical protein